MTEKNAQILNRLASLLDGTDVVSFDEQCDEIEIEPAHGFRQFKPGPHVIVKIVVKRTGGTGNG